MSKEPNLESKRLNVALDSKTFQKLTKIKTAHGDSSYTQAIKRAIAYLEFIDSKKEEGWEVYLGASKPDEKKSTKESVLQIVTTH